LLIIPGGRAFYDRVEVKMILYYLRVISNPADNNAFAEVVNLPKRGVGDVTVKSLIEEADGKRTSIWELMEKGPLATGFSAKARNGISRFMKIIKDARKMLSDEEGHTIASLMKHVIETVELEDYLKKTYPEEEDYQSRLENVKEILALAEEADSESSDYNDEPLPEVEGLEQNDLSTPLSNFLAKISLATDKRAKDAEGEDKPRVTISTIHAAKGLEWPVVFIPGAYDGSIPNGRADDTDEERRLLYVGMTRAKALLYVSYPLVDSRREATNPSNFLSPTSLLLHFGKKGPSFGRQNVISDIAAILRLEVPKITFSPDELPLPSQEDDLWPEDGTAKARPPMSWNEWDGTALHGEARRLPVNERPQLVDKRNMEPWKPSYTTTMAMTPAFSTAAAVLREQPVNLSGAGSAKRPFTFDDEQAEDKKSTKRSTKRPEGQPSLAAYFGKPRSNMGDELAPTITAARRTYTTQPSVPLPRMHHRTIPPQRGNLGPAIPAQSAPYVPPTICPTLSRHRIGGTTSATATSRRSIRAFTPPESSANNYIFLSSSPPRLEPSSKEHEAPRLPLPSNPVIATVARTASLHTTTEDRAKAQPGRRSYGARMGMGGWEKRMGGSGSWKPPSMADRR
jgi:DNA helicase-2/ATP-dependent DNA helicase PcrA